MKNIIIKALSIFLICILCMGNPPAYGEGVSLDSVCCIDREGRHSNTFYADSVCFYAVFSRELPENAEAQLYMCSGEDEILLDSRCEKSYDRLLLYPERVLEEGKNFKIKFNNVDVSEYTFTTVLLEEDTYFYTDFSEKKMMSLYQSGGTFTSEKREGVARGKIAKGVICNPCIDFIPAGIENEKNYVIDVKMKINTLENGAKLQLFDAKDENSSWRIGNYIHSNGYIYTRDPQVSPRVTVGQYKKGEWFTYSVAYDTEKSTSTAYINGEVKAENIPLYGAENPDVFRLDLKNESNSASLDVEIDTVRIYGGNEILDESIKSGEDSNLFYIWDFDDEEENIIIQQNNGFIGREDNFVLSGKVEEGVVSGACADAIAYSVQNANSYVIDTMIKINTLESGATIQLFDAKDENSSWRVGNYIHSNGDIYTRDPQVSPRVTVGQYEKGKWFRYSVIYDIPGQKSDVYINGELTAEDIPLWGAERVNCFRIDLKSSGAAADIEIDHVKIYGGTTLCDSSKKLYSNDSIMEDVMDVKQTIGDNMAFSFVSDYYLKDGVRKKYTSNQQKPYLTDGKVYLSPQFTEGILGMENAGTISAESCANHLGMKYIYDDRGFFILSEDGETYENSPIVSVIFEKSDIIYRNLVFDNPSGEEMLHTINKNMGGVHPKILHTADEVQYIKEKCATEEIWQNALEKVKSSAQRYLNRQQSFSADCLPADKQNMARLFQDAIHALATAYLLTDDSTYADKAVEYMKMLAMWDDSSSDVSNLTIGHWAMGMAIGYDSFYGYLSETEEGRETLSLIKTAVKRVAVSEIANTYRGGNWLDRWTRINDNFSGVCSGGMMALSLAFAHEEDMRKDLIILLENLIKTQQIAVSLFHNDGGYYEGIGYADYALGNLCLSIEAMFKICNTDFGLGRAMGFDKAGEFFTYAQSGSNPFNFSDCSQSFVYTTLPFWFYYRYNNEAGAKIHLDAYEAYGYTPDINALYYLKDMSASSEVQVPLDRYFTGAEVGVFRNAYDVKNQVFAAFHGGFTGIKHDMLDTGQFVFESDGVKWAMDLGKDSYSIPGYFARSGYKIYRKKTEGENCVVINPHTDADTYFGQEIGEGAELLFFESAPSCAMAAYDLTALYSRDALSYKRGYYFGDNRNTFIIRDEISLKEKSRVYWFMHTEADIAINGSEVTLSHNGKRLKAEIYCSEENYEILKLPCVQLDESLKVSGQSDDSGLYKLAIHCPEAEGNVVISVKLIPDRPFEKGENMSNAEIDAWTLTDEEMPQKTEISNARFDGTGFFYATVQLPENTESAQIYINGITYEFYQKATVPYEISTDRFASLNAGIYKGYMLATGKDGNEQKVFFDVSVPIVREASFYENNLSLWDGTDIYTDNMWNLYTIGEAENNGQFCIVTATAGESAIGFRAKSRDVSYAMESGSVTFDFDIKFSSHGGYFVFEALNSNKNWILSRYVILNNGRDSSNRDYISDRWYSIKAVADFDQNTFTVFLKGEDEESYRCILQKTNKNIHSIIDIKLRYQGECAGEMAYLKNFVVTTSEKEDAVYKINLSVTDGVASASWGGNVEKEGYIYLCSYSESGLLQIKRVPAKETAAFTPCENCVRVSAFFMEDDLSAVCGKEEIYIK